jgi:hypothetical protein
MAKTFYITTHTRQQRLTLLASEGDIQTVSLDFTAWAEDNAALTTATWAVVSGSATVAGQALASSVASARITTTDPGTSVISITATDGTRTKVVFIRVACKDPGADWPASDYQ